MGSKSVMGNGNIGTNGVSYLAVTQWWVASLNPPHLKAMIPWEGLNDIDEVAFSRRYTRYWLLSFLDSRYFLRDGQIIQISKI